MAGAQQVQSGGARMGVKLEEEEEDEEEIDEDEDPGEFDVLFDGTDLKGERCASASSSDVPNGIRDPRKRPTEEALEPDLTKLSTPVWALKIPKWLADRWADLEEEDVDLGAVVFHEPIDGVAKPDASIILSDAAVNKGLPKEYRLTVLETSRKSLYAFSEHEDGTVEINGIVATECEAQPVMCQELRHILEKREQEQAANKAPILLTNEEMKPNAIVPGLQTLSLPLRKPPTKQQILESKTARMPKNELLDLLFSAFEKYQLWTFKGILEYVRQPISYTREVLQEVAVLHKKGEHTGKYELKPEFRRSGSGAAPAAAGEIKGERPLDGGEESALESGEEVEEMIGDEEESVGEDEFEEVE